MALRLIRALPGEAAFLAPVADGKTSADVAPGSRRQDHTTSPYAASVSSGERTRLTPQRPSQPAPRSVTIAQRPFWQRGLSGPVPVICPTCQAQILVIGIDAGVTPAKRAESLLNPR